MSFWASPVLTKLMWHRIALPTHPDFQVLFQLSDSNTVTSAPIWFPGGKVSYCFHWFEECSAAIWGTVLIAGRVLTPKIVFFLNRVHGYNSFKQGVERVPRSEEGMQNCACAHTRTHGHEADRTLLVNSVDHKAQNRNSSTDDVGPDRLETHKKSQAGTMQLLSCGVKDQPLGITGYPNTSNST